MSEYLSPKQAVEHYNLRTNPENLSEFGRELAEHGIVAIEQSLTDADFKALSDGFAVCLEECPELLAATAHSYDSRYGNEAGYVKKEKKIDQRTGIQVSDAKDYFHFNEAAWAAWLEQLRSGPKVLRDFLQDGREIHNAAIRLAKTTMNELEPSHPNITNLYFPDSQSSSVLRLLRYRKQKVTENLGEVASPHYDIGGGTYQLYADAPGFWAAKAGVHGERMRYDSEPGQAHMFLGKGHEKVYGKNDTLKPLWHGVERVIPAGVTLIPERTAVILFLNSPQVDYHVREQDTRPSLNREIAKPALALC